MRNANFLAILIAILAHYPAPADEPVPIPLNDIWALAMPGARDIRELDSAGAEESIVDQALKQINEMRKFNHCYAVAGEGADALREFLRVRTDHEHWNRLSADKPISLVFFTRPIAEAVALVAVDRRGHSFDLRFRFAPPSAATPSPHLALIPVGKLPAGDYYVFSKRSPADPQDVAAGFEDPPSKRDSDVCPGCSFQVVDGPGGPPPPAKTIEIPLSEVWAYRMPGTRDINEFGSLKAEESLVQKVLLQIRDSWHHHVGMVVQGNGREALENVLRKRTEKGEWSEVSSKSPVSLVFYTRGIHEYVHLDGIEKSGNTFTIRYRLVPNKTASSRSTIALIPIGRLTPGKYTVSMKPLPPLEAEYLEQGFRTRPPLRPSAINDVCSSFSFMVLNRR